MYSSINKFKFGDCSQCGAKDTDVVKVKKDTFCVSCHQKNKALEQIDRQKKRNALRGDSTKLRKIIKRGEQDNNIAEMSALVDEVDALFSLWVRLKDADSKGFVKCFCCPKILHYTQAHNSHYIRRGHMATRFMPQNCRPSCPQCNKNHNDNKEPYRSLLEKESPGIIDFLEEQVNTVCKFTLTDLKELREHYRFKVKLVKSKLEPHTPQ